MTAPLVDQIKNAKKNDLVAQLNNVTKIRDNSVNFNTIYQGNDTSAKATERMAAYQRRTHTRGNSNNIAVDDSKSPDKYVINQNLVVNLNDSIAKPVKRENSNTTHHTHVTGVTTSTAITGGSNVVQLRNNAFYQT